MRCARSTNSFACPKDWVKGRQRSLGSLDAVMARILLWLNAPVGVNENILTIVSLLFYSRKGLLASVDDSVKPAKTHECNP